ncbi:MAG: DUF4198 domain-containing protein [Sphingomonadales bacterium]|nr:DUF4198 domain-containing protein [Sphingomonadales bacterium]
MHMKTRLIAAAALIALSAPGLAHRGWLLPSATIFSGSSDWVTVDAAASNDLFFPDHRPMPTANIKVWAPDGSEGKIANAATGSVRSTFDVQLDKPGTWKIGTVQSGVGGSFKVDGVEYRLGGRRGPGGPGGPGAPANPNAPRFVSSVDEIPANATDIQIIESSGRNEIFATAGEPTTTVFQPTNKGLEMQPITHPAELVQGEPAQFRFLVDGKPAPNLKVTIIPGGKRYRDGDGAFEVTTGADGIARVDFPEAGMFWLNTSLADKSPSAPKATGRRMSYTATLEVMAP